MPHHHGSHIGGHHRLARGIAAGSFHCRFCAAFPIKGWLKTAEFGTVPPTVIDRQHLQDFPTAPYDNGMAAR